MPDDRYAISTDQQFGPYERLVGFLDAEGADYRVVEHVAEGRTDVVSGLRGHPLGAAAKCMVAMVKLDKKRRRFVVAVVPGDRRVDLDALKRHYGGRYAGMADTADAVRLSGCEVGTILPFSWDDELDLVVDPALYEHEVIWFNAGRLDRSVALRSADHRRIATPTEAAIAGSILHPCGTNAPNVIGRDAAIRGTVRLRARSRSRAS